MLPPIPQVLPVVTVQPTLGEVLHEVQEGIIPFERVWISCYKTSETSVHGKFIAVLDDVDRDLVTLSKEEPGIEFDFIGNGKHGHEFKASCPSLGIPETKILLPSQEYNKLDRTNTKRPQPITAFDVSPDVSRFAVGYGDGSIFVYPTSSIPGKPSFLQHKPPASQSKVSARPHVSEVTTLKFFPSSRVLLTGGLDFSLSIVSAELPDPAPNAEPQKVEPVRTFRGHSRSVTGTAILGPGRNFLSSSADSTVKLWDAPSGTTINTIFASSRSPILSISLGSRLSRYGDATTATHRDEREAQEVADKGVFCGLGNGTFELLDLSTKSSVYQSPTTSTAPISSIAYSSNIHLLATGAGNGVVTIYDVRSLDQPLTSFVRQEGGITDMAFLSSSRGPGDFGLAIATSDGLPFATRLGPDGSFVVDELVGVDCDPVRSVRVRNQADGDEVWLASDDGVVRRYRHT
ncbi:hypothetical protein CC1G_02206 [Coprinopsis cinerea okayama7|uniref:Uncharacterized protein n=1 Tax=Coprinopsis cinerea (strain Okayama-7 / 130 / ATCC MYA-4618 / FGSC 9003) TaxID=240176 RepID=A8NKJ7_COPC7|nr:hypothetical protein CC1G_02206 [Coprinopsis cinerea okayama7\|eukprot:XP_001834470.2 hypothetical protein CC1G_02206 [Coprinopsis cinerea okayama7\